MRKGEKTDTIKVMLVDDHPIYRDGVRNCLHHHLQIRIVGEASSGEEAILRARELRPDVVLMDITMPKMDGIEATKQMTRALPKIKVLALTVHDTKEYILQIIRSGARGYLLKDVSPDDLVSAIKAVHAGTMFFSHGVEQVVLDFYMNRQRGVLEPGLPRLTQREREVLALIGEGHGNREIAGQLFISARTVQTHRENIMKKLRIHSSAGLIRFAI